MPNACVSQLQQAYDKTLKPPTAQSQKKPSVMGHKLTGRNTECKEIRKHGPPPMEGYTPSSKPRPSPHRLLI